MPDLLEVLAGVVAGAAGLVLAAVLRSTSDASLIAAVALAAMLAGTGLGPVAVLPAVGLIIAGSLIERWPPRLAALAGGTMLLGLAMPSEAPGWFQPATMVAIVVALLLVEASAHSFGAWATPWLLAVVPIAAYGAVPDTEQITPVAVAWAIVVAGLLVTRSQASRAGVAAVTALTVWAIAAGAAGREASLVAWGGFGLLVAAPLWWVAQRRLRWRTPVGAILALAHALGAAVIARGPTLGSDLSDAAGSSGLVLGWMLALAVLAIPLGRRRAEAGQPE